MVLPSTNDTFWSLPTIMSGSAHNKRVATKQHRYDESTYDNSKEHGVLPEVFDLH
jgi:hypothetical protein